MEYVSSDNIGELFSGPECSIKDARLKFRISKVVCIGILHVPHAESATQAAAMSGSWYMVGMVVLGEEFRFKEHLLLTLWGKAIRSWDVSGSGNLSFTDND